LARVLREDSTRMQEKQMRTNVAHACHINHTRGMEMKRDHKKGDRRPHYKNKKSSYLPIKHESHFTDGSETNHKSSVKVFALTRSKLRKSRRVLPFSHALPQT
jgi:hypothetical protein